MRSFYFFNNDKWALLALIFILPISAFSNRSSDHEKVVVSVSVPWEPYSYFDKSGQLVGTDIEVLRKTLAELNQEVDYVPGIPLKRLASSKGKLGFNTILAATYNEERAKDNYFSVPYRTEKIAVFVTNKKYLQLNSIEKLLNKGLIGALNTSGFYGESFERIKGKYAKQLFHSESVKRKIKKLMANRIDFFIDDITSVRYTIDTLELSRVYQSTYLLAENEVSFMFVKSEFSPQFINEFNQALTKVLSEPKN